MEKEKFEELVNIIVLHSRNANHQDQYKIFIESILIKKTERELERLYEYWQSIIRDRKR